jgi:nucleoside-diphosphate-sugar epimerase
MRVFIAGATGTLGLPLARALVARNHQVIGLSRSREKEEVLRQAGAAAVIADALNAEDLAQAVRSTSPNCVIDLLTAIPKNGPTRTSHMKATNELRIRGTANLLRAAVAAGAQRIVGESMIFAYGFGDHGKAAKTEVDTLQRREANAGLQEMVDATRSLENQLLQADKQGLIEAIPLRYGLFYGAESASTVFMLRMLKKQLLPKVSGAKGINSWIHVDDAASATIAAMEHGQPGEIYNLVDDHAVSFNDWFSYAATEMHAKQPFSIPLWLLRLFVPYVASCFSTRLRVSNRKAKSDLHWRPHFPSYLEGVRQVIAEWEKKQDYAA